MTAGLWIKSAVGVTAYRVANLGILDPAFVKIFALGPEGEVEIVQAVVTFDLSAAPDKVALHFKDGAFADGAQALFHVHRLPHFTLTLKILAVSEPWVEMGVILMPPQVSFSESTIMR